MTVSEDRKAGIPACGDEIQEVSEDRKAGILACGDEIQEVSEISEVSEVSETSDSILSDDLIVVSQPVGATQFRNNHRSTLSPAEGGKLSVEAPYSSRDTLSIISGYPRSIYFMPASWNLNEPWWHGMWINTAVLSGAFISTLLVLETLPEDATTWNRAELRQDPFYHRWFNNIFKRGPEWDHDNPVFNFVLHPYAGAAYFMAARTCGFNFWRSMLYSACISTFGWEFGIEACMERPSYQDLVITPVIGSLMGEGFYRLKRLIVDNNYEILGSPVLGHIAAFFLDPVNEVVGALSPGTCRSIGPGCLSSQPLLIPSPGMGGGSAVGFTISATF